YFKLAIHDLFSCCLYASSFGCAGALAFRGLYLRRFLASMRIFVTLTGFGSCRNTLFLILRRVFIIQIKRWVWSHPSSTVITVRTSSSLISTISPIH
ncbi:hypothetical protein KX358_27665, partial [Escherichia coli]|nr:hypothetical protein [Escherichia coli]